VAASDKEECAIEANKSLNSTERKANGRHVLRNDGRIEQEILKGRKERCLTPRKG
jgi:hypothetical protein